jgi:phage-related protein
MIRKIIAFGGYYDKFISSASEKVRKKIYYVLDMLSVQERISRKFVRYIRNGIYEIRIMHESNIYRLFFIFDEGNIIVLFNGFQKKTQETPETEIQRALKIKDEYYEYKQNHKC